MDVDSSQGRMAAYMRHHQDKVVSRWSELVVASVRGRSSAVELRRELEDLYALVIRAMSGSDRQAAGELRAALTELSRSRARNGFTPSETALAVFSLKDAVNQLVADTAEMAPEYLAFSRMVDGLGLHTFETYAAAREQIIADQALSMLELSTRGPCSPAPRAGAPDGGGQAGRGDRQRQRCSRYDPDRRGCPGRHPA